MLFLSELVSIYNMCTLYHNNLFFSAFYEVCLLNETVSLALASLLCAFFHISFLLAGPRKGSKFLWAVHVFPPFFRICHISWKAL